MSSTELLNSPGNPMETEVAAFMQQSDALIDREFKVDLVGDGNLLTVVLEDAVNRIDKGPDDSTIGRTPVVRLANLETGSYSDMEAADFLQALHNADTGKPASESQDISWRPKSEVGYEVESEPPREREPEVSEEEAMTSVEDAAAKDEVMAARQQISAIGVAEKLGLPSDTTAEQVADALTNKINDLQGMVRSLNEFEPVRLKASREIAETLATQMNRLSGKTRDGLSAYLSGSFQGLESLTREVQQGKALLSPGFKKDLDALGRSLLSFRGDNDTMVARGRNWIDADAAHRVKRVLDQLPRLTPHLAAELHEATDLLSQVSGYAKANEVYESGHEKTQSIYRNEQVENWQKELTSPHTTPERVKQVEAEMENAVAIEAGMVDDPKSPQVWFDRAVVENRQKSRREGIHFSGRVGADIPSQRHVAEIMSDMLSGKFNVQGGNSPLPIELKDEAAPAHQRVKSGVHRVAALAMLYGNDWPKAAREKGIRVEKAR